MNNEPWNNEEQQLLEQAMKTFPSSLGSERWDKIAECIPNRSRTDCIKRYKYLVELVKSKNAAKTVIHKKK
jgi:DnaJ family protein C protein 2